MPDPVIDPVVDPITDPVEEPSVDWRDGFQEDIKGEKSLDSFTNNDGTVNIEALAKSTVSAQKMIGGSVRIPGEDATPEEIEAYYTKLGRPDTVEGYEFTKPDLPDGVQWNEKLFNWFGAKAHELGMSKTQAQGLMNAWNENQFSEVHELQKVQKENIDALRREWGDQFDGHVELGLRGIEKLLSPEDASEFKALMDSTGFGDNPLFLKLAYGAGHMLKEDGYILSSSSGGIMGVESAKEEINNKRRS
jgi:hypothetical protein